MKKSFLFMIALMSSSSMSWAENAHNTMAETAVAESAESEVLATEMSESELAGAGYEYTDLAPAYDDNNILTCMIDKQGNMPMFSATLSLEPKLKGGKDYLIFEMLDGELLTSEGGIHRTVFSVPVSQSYQSAAKNRSTIYVKTNKAWYSFSQPITVEAEDPTEIVIKQHYLQNGKTANTMRCIMELAYNSQLSTFKHKELKQVSQNPSVMKTFGISK